MTEQERNVKNQVALYINQQFCMGCKTCQIACKDKHDNEVGVNFLQVKEFSGGGFSREGAGFTPEVWAYWVPTTCHQCDRPGCAARCPVGAIAKSAVDGTITIDAERCTGCRACEQGCPYDALQYSERKRKVLGCDLCADYRAAGRDPACVAACPMRVLDWGVVEDLKKQHPEAVTVLQGLTDPAVTGPNTLYEPHRHAVRQAD